MNRRRPSFRCVLVLAALGNVAVGRPAIADDSKPATEADTKPADTKSATTQDTKPAADLPTKAPKAEYEWSGLYFGGHFGYGVATLGAGTNPLPRQAVILPHSATGLVGGYQMGYNYELTSHLVLGIEGDATFTGPVDTPALVPAPFNTTLDYVGTVRGRVGYAFDRFMPYVTGGFAWGHSTVNINAEPPPVGNVFSTVGHYQPGWTAGLGLEFAVSGNWTAKLEYDYIDLARRTFDLSEFALPAVTVAPRIQFVKLGLNYQFGDSLWDPKAKPKLPDSDAWNVHLQTTFLPQGYLPFHSPYAGANSLPGSGQIQETWTTTAFLGVRLWDGGEFYFNPEVDQGFGLNGSLGLAGFPNGEAQKAGGVIPIFRAQRYYLKQTFGLGGEQEDVADGPNQLPGKRDIDRVTVVLGRFAIGDFFDNNAYAHDPRADFMNWALWGSGAYDFPADLPGYTTGVMVELNRKDWAIRGAYVEMPTRPNSDELTLRSGGGAVVEYEYRQTLFDQPGKIRVGAFDNQGFSGNYRDALAIEAADPSLNINDVIASIAHVNPKYGFYANLEQQVVKDVGLFARVSWNDGQSQIMSFTDIDHSLSGGFSIKGSYWGRDNDTIGIGGAINGLSAAHRDFLAAGGLGLLIGDGQLSYSPEEILEAYYAYQVTKSFTVTADYQFIRNPAYNADRGPVSLFACRLHGEF